MMYKEELTLKIERKLRDNFAILKVPVFIQEYFINFASAESKKIYWGVIKNFFQYMFIQPQFPVDNFSDLAIKHLEEITGADATKYFLALLGKNERTTIETKRKQLSSFFGYLKDYGYVEKNIILLVKNPKLRPNKESKKNEQKLPTEENLSTLEFNISNCPNEFIRVRNLAIFYLLRGSGLREKELVGLDMKDWAYKNGLLHVCILPKGCYLECDKKWKACAQTVGSYFDNWVNLRKSIDCQTDALFINRDGRRLREAGVIKVFKNYSNNTITPHMLRHYCSTMLYQHSGHDLIAVQDQLGHSRMSTIAADHYISTEQKMIETLSKM